MSSPAGKCGHHKDMATAEAVLSRPFWSMANTLVLPVVSDEDGDGRSSLRSLVSLSLPITVFLDTILGHSRRGRSLGEDQLHMFRTIEQSLAGVGVDGRACLLRVICEVQKNPVGQVTLLGEVLMLLLTPKREARGFLQQYQEAEMAGLDGEDCQAIYHTCPFSLTHHHQEWLSTPGLPEMVVN